MKSITAITVLILGFAVMKPGFTQSPFGSRYDQAADVIINEKSRWFDSATNSLDAANYRYCIASYTVKTALMITGQLGALNDTAKMIHALEGRYLAEARKKLLRKGMTQEQLSSQVRRMMTEMEGDDVRFGNSMDHCTQLFVKGMKENK